MSKMSITLTVACGCGEAVDVEVNVSHDPGCRYTPNGDGWPESWDLDVLTETCPSCHTPLEGDVFDARINEAFSRHETPTRDDYAEARDEERDDL